MRENKTNWFARWRQPILGLLLFLLMLPFSTLAQHSYNWRVFKAADGLSESLCTAVSVSPQGHVWVKHGETETISRLDGYNIEHLPSPGGGSFRIYESRSGQLWSVYSGGIQVYAGNQWVKHPIAEIQLENQNNPTRQVRPVPLVPGNHHHVLYLLPDRLVEYNALGNRGVVVLRVEQTHLAKFADMEVSPDGTIWCTGLQGLLQISAYSKPRDSSLVWKEFLAPQQLRMFQRPWGDDDGGVTVMAEDANGEKALVYFDGQSWTIHKAAKGRMRQAWRSMEHGFWIQSVNNSLIRLEDDRELPEIEGALAGQFYDLAVESKGVFWIATSEGLVRCAPLPWRSPSTVTPPNPLIYSITQDAMGSLWFAGFNTLMRFDTGQWQMWEYPEKNEMNHQPSDALYLLPDQRLAMNASNHFLLIDPQAGPSQQRFTTVTHPADSALKILGQFHNGDLCVQVLKLAAPSSGYNLEIYDGHQFHLFQSSQVNWSKLGSELYFMYVTTNNQFWLGGNGGVGLLRDGRLQTFSRPADGEPPETALCMLEMPEGKIWCGGLGKISEFNGKTWTVFHDGMDRVNSMIRAVDGTIWVATSDGLFRYKKDSWLANGTEEGLLSPTIYDVYQDRQGIMWAGTARGLNSYFPSADIDSPRAFITTANKLNSFFLDSPVVVLFSGQDKWKFTPADRLLFSYRWGNNLWSAFSSDSTITLNNLLPGKQMVEVRAQDRNGNADLEHPAIFEFTVVQPWYQEPRLLMIAAIGGAFALFFAVLAVNGHLRLKRSFAEVGHIVAQRTHELEQANQALLHSQKMRALGTLAAGIAHDFNNILSIIKGSAQIIERNLDDHEKIRTRLNRIITVVEQGSGLVRTMLGFSRISNKDLVLEDINQVVEGALNLLADRFLQEITIHCELFPGLPKVSCAKELLKQMVLNLILNAADAMSGHGQVLVQTGLRIHLPDNLVLSPASAGSYVFVSISDAGTGISPEISSRIFEPFFTTKALSTRRGTGLGLSMVYEFAKDQGYGLHVNSEVNKGSTFTIFIPSPAESL